MAAEGKHVRRRSASRLPWKSLASPRGLPPKHATFGFPEALPDGRWVQPP